MNNAPSFAPSSALPGHYRAHAERAYTLAGLTPPWPAADAVAEALYAEPTASDLDAAARNPETTAAELLGLAARSQAADAARRAWDTHTNRRANLTHDDDMNRAAKDLAKPAAAVVRELATAAAALPHPDPLNTDAVFATDATKPYRAALDALARLSVFASVFDLRPGSGLTVRDHNGQALDRRAVHLTAVVDWPTPDTDPGTVAALVADLNRLGVDAVLTRTARGDYPGASLGLAPTVGDYDQRLDRLRATA